METTDLDLLDSTAVCELLSIDERTLRRWRGAGKFPPPIPDDGSPVPVAERWRPHWYRRDVAALLPQAGS